MKPNYFFAGAIFLVGLLNSTIFLPLVSNQQSSTVPPLPTITATATVTATQVIPTATATLTPTATFAQPTTTATATATATATQAIPTATATPTPTATFAQPTATATATATATLMAGPCSCERDLYNCSDFSTQAEAQACFDFCMDQVGRDVHRLDQDGNGIACESLPGQRVW